MLHKHLTQITCSTDLFQPSVVKGEGGRKGACGVLTYLQHLMRVSPPQPKPPPPPHPSLLSVGMEWSTNYTLKCAPPCLGGFLPLGWEQPPGGNLMSVLTPTGTCPHCWLTASLPVRFHQKDVNVIISCDLTTQCFLLIGPQSFYLSGVAPSYGPFFFPSFQPDSAFFSIPAQPYLSLYIC